MSSHDPRKELKEILDLCSKGELPIKAKSWAIAALANASSILHTVWDMEANGIDSTHSQDVALRNIYIGACRWLHRKP